MSLLTTLVLGACSNRTELDDSVQNLVFQTLKGEKISFSEINQPTLISFWSTSCVICIQEMPEMVRLYQHYKDRGFELIAVAMPFDAPNKVLELSEGRQLPFPVALDINGDILAAFSSVAGTPTSFLIDAQRQLVERYVGANKLESMSDQLDRLLGLS